MRRWRADGCSYQSNMVCKLVVVAKELWRKPNFSFYFGFICSWQIACFSCNQSDCDTQVSLLSSLNALSRSNLLISVIYVDFCFLFFALRSYFHISTFSTYWFSIVLPELELDKRYIKSSNKTQEQSRIHLDLKWTNTVPPIALPRNSVHYKRNLH